MKRAPALHGLSREHNHALVLARAAVRAGARGDPAVIRRCRDALATAWREEMAAHFAVEERHVIPVLEAIGEQALARRLLREHRAIRRNLEDPARHDGAHLAALGAVLRDHVRCEERHAFPLFEAHARPEALAAVGAHPDRRGIA